MTTIPDFLRSKTIAAYCLVVVLIAGLPGFCDASVWYVHADAPDGGYGTGWDDPFKSIPECLIHINRGDTVYVADGVYKDRIIFNIPEKNDEYISILKATVQSHGAAAGWADSLGDGQAVFSAGSVGYEAMLDFKTDNWVFDGITGKRDGRDEQYGFVAVFADSGKVKDGARLLQAIGDIDNISIRHTELNGTNPGKAGVVQPKIDGIYAFYSGTSQSGFRISWCYLHKMSRTFINFNNTVDSVVEHCWFEDLQGGKQVENGLYIHHEAISLKSSAAANDTIRNCVFKNTGGKDATAVIAMKGSTDHRGLYIYGNVFFMTSDTYMVNNGVIANTLNDNNSDMFVCNNTFYRINGTSGIRWYGSGVNNVAYNNLWYQCAKVPFIKGVALHDYNACDDTTGFAEEHAQLIALDPFVDSANFDFNMYYKSKPVDNGVNLDAVFLKDPAGTIHGAGDRWDIGAYEYGGPYYLSAPSELRTALTSDFNVVLSWILSHDDSLVTGYNLYRSKIINPEETVSLYDFDSFEEVVEAERTKRIYLGTVAAGTDAFTDHYVRFEEEYYYWIEAYNALGIFSSCTLSSNISTSAEHTLPEATIRLDRNSPNPFNMSTTLSFLIASKSQEHVKLKIYDIRGSVIRTLIDDNLAPGSYNIRWDGTSDGGQRVASGVFLYTLEAMGVVRSGKMLMLK